MKKLNILVLTAHSKYIQDEADITVPIFRDYCQKHGYHFACVTEGFDMARPYPWSKLRFIQQYLPHFDWVVWMDVDCLITNPDVSLKDIIHKHYDKQLLVAEEVFPSRSNPNTGVLFVKNTSFSRNFIKKWDAQTAFIKSEWEDQSALTHMLREKTYPEIGLCKQKEFNSMYINHSWTEGDFILHLAGLQCVYPKLTKPQVLKEYAAKIQKPKKYIHEYFDKVYMVNLKHRTDRANQMKVECDKIGLQYTRFEAIYSREISIPAWMFVKENQKQRFTPGAFALAKTTLKIIEEAIEKKYESILILEDDLKWHPDSFSIFQKAMDELPNNWQLLQLSQQHCKAPKPVPNKRYLVYTSETYFCSAYALHKSVFELYRQFLLNPYQPIDVWLVENLQKSGHSFGTMPNLAVQVPGISDIGYKYEDWAVNEHDFTNKPPKDISVTNFFTQ